MSTYKLVRDVKNPEADGRAKDDWRRAKVWEAGTTFTISDDNQDGIRKMIRVGGQYAVRNPASIALVLENSEQVEETVLAMLTRLEVVSYHARPFYRFLIKSGRISAEEFEKAWTEWQNTEDE